MSFGSKFLSVVALAIATAGFLAPSAQAFPKYAQKEKVECGYCHANPGGPRNFRGLYYGANDHSFTAFDETFEAKMAGVKVGSMGKDAMAQAGPYPNVSVPPVLRYTVKDIDGKPVNLGRYKGDVVMIVNVASKCGNTPQYASMEKLYEKYKAQGFTILGFPANDFGSQEPGTNADIKAFCAATYNVKFPMFSKITVKGEEKAPLYKFLTDKKTNPEYSKEIEWNFAKFLVNRKGEIVARFPAGQDPTKPEVIAVIEKQLAEKVESK